MAASRLPPFINALLDPAVYPHPVERVELLQTHISYVLLAGDFVYKVKKPVDFGFLDYSTLAKRRFYCRQEVKLNSRFCADTYLGVISIRRDGKRYSLSRGGQVVEYAVKMRRLPLKRRLDTLIEHGQATPQMLASLGEHLAQLHKRAETNPAIARTGELGIRQAWRENFKQWKPYIGRTITAEQHEHLKRYARSFIQRHGSLLKLRAESGRVRDCHGDLRSDSVVFRDRGDICIFDCIEFNRRFRYTDVAGDVGFLAMDLDYRDHHELATAFVDRYLRQSGDSTLQTVLPFFQCYRAAVRGKVEGFLLDVPSISATEKRHATAAARRYFELACRYAEADTPALLITYGLSGSGKSTLARELASQLGLEVVTSDVVRKQLAGLAPGERRREAVGGGIYAASFTDNTYRAMLERAESALRAGRSVLVDATFLRRQHRQWARRLAERAGARFLCLQVRAREATVRSRLYRRDQQGNDPSDARWEVYLAQKRSRERPDELTRDELLMLDSEQPADKLIDRVRQKLQPTL